MYIQAASDLAICNIRYRFSAFVIVTVTPVIVRYRLDRNVTGVLRNKCYGEIRVYIQTALLPYMHYASEHVCMRVCACVYAEKPNARF